MANEKRLIDLDANLKRLEKESWWLDEVKSCIRLFLAKAKVVDAVPVVHGRWKAHKPDCRGYTDGFICSCCGDTIYTDYCMKECEYNYCPNCGAKMDGDGNGTA